MFDLDLIDPRGGTVGIGHGLRAYDIDLVGGYNAADIGKKPFSIAARYLEPYGKSIIFAELPTHLYLALFVICMNIGTIFDMDGKASSACYKTYYIY